MKNLVISNPRYLRHKPWPLAGQLRTQISVSFTPIQAAPLHSTVSINFFRHSDFLKNSVACVAHVSKNAGEGNETTCKCPLATISLFFFSAQACSFARPLARSPVPSLCLEKEGKRLLRRLWIPFRLGLSQPETGGCYMFTMLTANASAFQRDDTNKCQISVGILGGRCRYAPVVLWNVKRIL